MQRQSLRNLFSGFQLGPALAIAQIFFQVFEDYFLQDLKFSQAALEKFFEYPPLVMHDD